jgi:hypothetical protein
MVVVREQESPGRSGPPRLFTSRRTPLPLLGIEFSHLLFGLTELKAQICWKENVRLFPVLIIVSLTLTPYRARKNGEVILTSCLILLIVCSLKGSSYYCVR